MIQRLFLTSFWILLLAACSSVSGPSGSTQPQESRYSLSQDRAPDAPLDPSQIREVVPTPVNRTMAGNRSPYTVNGQTYRVMASEEGFQQTGLASWYGEKFHGHATSNGEIFDMYQVSAAHTTLPLPSFVRVTNLENQRSIIVRVNDRGPFHSDRIIDLSYAAAWQLGYADQGTAMVHIEAVAPGQRALASAVDLNVPPAAVVGEERYLQAGAFSDLRAAQRLSERLQSMTSRPVFIRSVQAGDSVGRQQLHRVRVGPISDHREIQQITELMLAAGLGEPFMVNE